MIAPTVNKNSMAEDYTIKSLHEPLSTLAGDTQAAGRALAALNEVTHCYERPLNDAFPYNLFAMVHGTSVEEANRQFDLLKSCLSALDEPPTAAVMLLSTKEYKKTSISYYRT